MVEASFSGSPASPGKTYGQEGSSGPQKKPLWTEGKGPIKIYKRIKLSPVLVMRALGPHNCLQGKQGGEGVRAIIRI